MNIFTFFSAKIRMMQYGLKGNRYAPIWDNVPALKEEYRRLTWKNYNGFVGDNGDIHATLIAWRLRDLGVQEHVISSIACTAHVPMKQVWKEIPNIDENVEVKNGH